MIRPKLLALASLAALALPASAALAATGDPALDAFSSICLASPNDYLSIVKAADAAGWTETELVPEANDTVSVTDKAAREKSVGDVHLTLLVSRGLRHTKGGDVTEADCKVSTEKPDPGVVDKTKSWLGFAPDSGDATLAVFYVKPGGGQPAHIDGGATALNTAMSSGGFSVIKAQQDQSSSILVYTRFSK